MYIYIIYSILYTFNLIIYIGITYIELYRNNTELGILIMY